MKKSHNIVAPVHQRMIALKQIPLTYGIPYSTARQHIREGRLPAYRMPGGRQVYVYIEDLERLLVRVGGYDDDRPRPDFKTAMLIPLIAALLLIAVPNAPSAHAADSAYQAVPTVT
jgi:excisionase family DNA binding protein